MRVPNCHFGPSLNLIKSLAWLNLLLSRRCECYYFSRHSSRACLMLMWQANIVSYGQSSFILALFWQEWCEVLQQFWWSCRLSYLLVCFFYNYKFSKICMRNGKAFDAFCFKANQIKVCKVFDLHFSDLFFFFFCKCIVQNLHHNLPQHSALQYYGFCHCFWFYSLDCDFISGGLRFSLVFNLLFFMTLAWIRSNYKRMMKIFAKIYLWCEKKWRTAVDKARLQQQSFVRVFERIR